jgi:hypothetical protein
VHALPRGGAGDPLIAHAEAVQADPYPWRAHPNWAAVSQPLRDLIEALGHADPRQRASIAQAMAMPFVTTDPATWRWSDSGSQAGGDAGGDGEVEWAAEEAGRGSGDDGDDRCNGGEAEGGHGGAWPSEEGAYAVASIKPPTPVRTGKAAPAKHNKGPSKRLGGPDACVRSGEEESGAAQHQQTASMALSGPRRRGVFACFGCFGAAGCKVRS